MVRKITIELIKKELHVNHPGSKLISTEYISYKSKLDLICKKGHIFKITCGDLRAGCWCSKCAGNKKKTIEDVLNFIKTNYPKAKLLSKEYINSKSKLDLICESGHNFNICYSCIKSGHWCAECSGNKKKTIKDVDIFISEKHPNSKLLSTEYKNAFGELDVICENKHSFKINWNHIYGGVWYPICAVKKGEELVRKILEDKFKSSFPNMKPKWLKNPKTNHLLQLDGFCEELSLAFEYQGIQHYKYPNHCHKNKKQFEAQIYRDNLKKQLCKENNIILIEIREIEYLTYENVELIVNSVLKEKDIIK